MFTNRPGASGYTHINYSRINRPSVQQASEDTALTTSFRKATPISDCISYLKFSAPLVSDAFHFFESESEKQELIQFYRQKTGNGFLFIIRHPDDLDRHPLRMLQCCPAPGKKEERPGLIYQSVPITLVFDCDNLKPRQLASLNELFEYPPQLDGTPISKTVSRIVIVNEDLKDQPDAPGPDFWRRVFALKGPGSAEFNPTSSSIAASPLLPVRQRWEPPEPGSLQIRCSGRDAYTSLFGNLAINSAGKQYFRKGMIYGQREPVTICLVDPPAVQSQFWQHLTDVLEQGYFIANGERVELPPSLRLEQYHTPAVDIAAFRHKINNTPANPDKTCGVINSHSFEAIFSDLSTQGGTLQQIDTFQKIASEFEQLSVSDDLTNHQWLILKHRAELLPTPPALVAEMLPEFSGGSAIRFYSDEVANVAASNCYHLATGQHWEELWFTDELKLSGRCTFRLKQTPLLKKLLAGETVVLIGLELAPALAGHLESLLAPEPYLWIYGQKIELPKNGRIDVVWPKDCVPPRGAWYHRWQQLQVAESQLARAAEPTVMARHPEVAEPLTRLLDSIKTLPKSADKSFPQIPVQAPSEFLKRLEAQLHIEQELDRAGTLEPFHWRKALNKLLAHPVRGNAKIYSFVKAQINAQFPYAMAGADGVGVDSDGVVAILETMPAPNNAKDLRDNFWPMARYMVPVLADYLPTAFGKIPDSSVKRMAAIIHAMFPEQIICIDPLSGLDSGDGIQTYQGNRLSLLYNTLLVMASESNYQGIPVHQYAMILNYQLSAIAQQHHPANPVVQLRQHLRRQLQHCFPEPLPAKSLRTLAADWLQASRNHNQQQPKRLAQLMAMLKQHKIIELVGPSGTGKSCLAETTGQALQKQQYSPMDWLAVAIGLQSARQAVKNMTLGPNTTWEDLYGAITLKKDRFGNLVSQVVPGQISEWARSSRPGLLVLNEANLVSHGLLSPLTGLLLSPPRLCANGETIWLTDKHRVLLTGNPESYLGRNLEPALKSRVPRLYYRPLPQSVLKQAIIEPLLPDGWPMELTSTAPATILSLLAEYEKLVSADYELTPRDLKDIMARFKMIATDAPCPTKNEQLFALADEACRQSLGGRIDPDKQLEWQELRTYWRWSGEVDSQILDQHQQAFNQFFSRLAKVNQKASKPLVINTGATREYIKTCWEFLQLREPGRVAMVVEGIAGWGKDALLMLTLDTWQQQAGKGYQHLNGMPDRFPQFVQAFNRAWRLGEVLVVSELNVIPPGPLEEFLNDRLALPHKAGFKLIGTINPPSYSGRTAFPPSLASRFTGVGINIDILDDYRHRLQASGASEQLSRWLTECAHAINHNLRKRHIPFELTLPQILQAADRLSTIPLDYWFGHLNREWRLYLNSCSHPFAWPHIVGHSSTESGSRSTAIRSEKSLATTFSMGAPPDTCPEFQVTRYFPQQWDTRLYRLELFTACVTKGQGLARSSVPNHFFDQSYILPRLTKRSYLTLLETPGRMTLKPGSKWQPLPSLTPEDILVGLQTTPAGVKLELARDRQNGLYFVRSRLAEPVTVDFIIKPDLTYFEPITSDESVTKTSKRCPALIKVHLDREVFHRKPTDYVGYQELRKIADLRNLPERLLTLADWFNGFSYDRNFTETGIDLVKRLMQEKQGSCRHRVFLFQTLCLYWGIEARIVASVEHYFVEVKCAGQWRLMNLGGTAGGIFHYSPEPEWGSLYQASAQPITSDLGSPVDEHDSGWNRVFNVVASLFQQWQLPFEKLPQEAQKLIQDTVQDEFQKKFRNISFAESLSRQFYFETTSLRISAFGVVYHWAPEQYLLAAKHAIEHFSTLALPERRAIVDWSHLMLNWSFKYQSAQEHHFCQWLEFAWKLYQQSPNDFPVLPVRSLMTVMRFNFDHTGLAQELCERMFRVESINRAVLDNVGDTQESADFSFLAAPGKFELPLVPVTDIYWSGSSQGRPDIARLIRGEPCFQTTSINYQEPKTLIFSAERLLDKAMKHLEHSVNKLTGAPFVDELPEGSEKSFMDDYNGRAQRNHELIRLISDKSSAEIYTPVMCKELKRFRVLIVGNFCDRITIFESPAGKNFNLIGSGIFSQGFVPDERESLEKIKRLINEHDATVLEHG